MSDPISLYVGNIPYTVDDTSLFEAFKCFGAVKAQVIKDNSLGGSGQSKGFGFVEFASHDACKGALDQIGGSLEIDGRPCKVNFAHGGRDDRGSGGRSGGFGGRGGRGGGRGGRGGGGYGGYDQGGQGGYGGGGGYSQGGYGGYGQQHGGYGGQQSYGGQQGYGGGDYQNY